MENQTNLYAQAALRERRAICSGEITTLERRVRHLRESLVQIDTTIRMFDPDADPSKIPATKPYKRVKPFEAGKLNWMILSVLRKAEKSMAISEVGNAIIQEQKFGPEAAKGLRNRVRANLLYLTKVREQTVKAGDRETAKWKLVGEKN